VHHITSHDKTGSFWDFYQSSLNPKSCAFLECSQQYVWISLRYFLLGVDRSRLGQGKKVDVFFLNSSVLVTEQVGTSFHFVMWSHCCFFQSFKPFFHTSWNFHRLEHISATNVFVQLFLGIEHSPIITNRLCMKPAGPIFFSLLNNFIIYLTSFCGSSSSKKSVQIHHLLGGALLCGVGGKVSGSVRKKICGEIVECCCMLLQFWTCFGRQLANSGLWMELVVFHGLASLGWTTHCQIETRQTRSRQNECAKKKTCARVSVPKNCCFVSDCSARASVPKNCCFVSDCSARASVPKKQHFCKVN